MKKNPLIIILSTVIIIAGSFIAYSVFTNTASDSQQNDNHTMTKEEAIKEAENFEAPHDQMCTQVMTPARHKETGAVYTFPTGCLPDGWEREDSPKTPAPADSEGADKNVDKDDARSNQSAPAPVPSAPNEALRTSNNNTAPSTQKAPSTSSEQTEAGAALAAARSYRPPKGQHCTTVMTPARHIKTGVLYTFPSGCLPDGWERVNPGQMIPY